LDDEPSPQDLFNDYLNNDGLRRSPFYLAGPPQIGMPMMMNELDPNFTDYQPQNQTFLGTILAQMDHSSVPHFGIANKRSPEKEIIESLQSVSDYEINFMQPNLEKALRPRN
jgi:hypothetical protein